MYAGRARSRTDPGTSCKGHIIKPRSNTPNGVQTGSDIFSGRHQKYPNDYGMESELEYQYEIDAREQRRLIVMNANVVPSSSESEIESRVVAMDGKTRLPMLAEKWRQGRSAEQWKVGLDYSLANMNRARAAKDQPLTDNGKSSTYHEQDHGIDTMPMPYSTSSRSSIDKLTEIHCKRREALLGIVNGLGLESEDDVQSCGDGESCVMQEGLAISGSGDLVGGLEDHPDIGQKKMGDDESVCLPNDEPEHGVAGGFEETENLEKFERDDDSLYNFESSMPTFVVSTEDDSCKQRDADPFLCSSDTQHVLEAPTPSQVIPPTARPSSGVGTQRRKEHLTESKGRKSPSRSPVVRNSVGISIPASLKRYSVYGDRDLVLSNAVCQEVTDAEPVQALSQDSDTFSLSESSYAAAARERKAFGIPPSESDEVFQLGERDWNPMLPHAESDLSSLGSTFWHEDCDELSVGAEALFRSLSGKSDRKSCQVENEEPGGLQSDAPHFQDEENARRSPSISHSPSSSSVHEGRLTDPTWPERGGHGPSDVSSSNNRTWRSTLPPSVYDTLLDQHGGMEMERQEVIWELCETEEAFVDRLHGMARLFILPLRVRNTKTWISGVPSEVARFFDWLEDIVVLHKQILSALHTTTAEQSPVVERVAESMRQYVARFEVYQPYIVRVDPIVRMVRQLVQDPGCDFGEFVKMQQTSPDCRGWILERFLFEPENRLTTYCSLFQVSFARPRTRILV